MPASPAKFVRCVDGHQAARGVTYKGGNVYRADDPHVQKYPHLFVPLDGTVEAAVSEPGQLRVVHRKRAPKAAK